MLSFCVYIKLHNMHEIAWSFHLEYTKHVKGQTGRFMALFSVISFGFLAILLAAMTLLA